MTRWSLAPDRAHASSPSEVARLVVQAGDSPALVDALGEGLELIDDAIATAFPRNLFWDLEYLAATLAAQARLRPDPGATVRENALRIASLQDLFGGATNIRFRYVHDFLYGFDWAKWVDADPRERSAVEAFDPRFVDAMHSRGVEIVAAIAAGSDAKYPPLPEGRARNPFGFSREPDAEARLMRHLADRGELPVAAWSVQAAPVWNLPYAALRRKAADELGLVKVA